MCVLNLKPTIFKKVMASIAQIVILVLILPGVIIILNWLVPDIAKKIVVDTLGQIPLIDTLTSYYQLYQVNDFDTTFSLFSYIIETINQSFFSMYIVGLTVDICKNLLRFNGIAAFQTVLGIFLSTICLGLIGDNVEKSIICAGVLMIVDFIIALLFSKTKITTFLWKNGLGITMSTITAGTLCAYLTVIALIIKGHYGSFWLALNALIWAAVFALICLLVDYLLFGKD